MGDDASDVDEVRKDSEVRVRQVVIRVLGAKESIEAWTGELGAKSTIEA